VDVETSEVIDRINARIDALEVSLRSEIRGASSGVRDELRAEIRSESSSVRDELRAEIRSQSSSVRDELRVEFREGFAENRRHTEVLYESLRDDIRILADGFAAMSTKLDSLPR
jgi:hypothetical protein